MGVRQKAIAYYNIVSWQNRKQKLTRCQLDPQRDGFLYLFEAGMSPIDEVNSKGRLNERGVLCSFPMRLYEQMFKRVFQSRPPRSRSVGVCVFREELLTFRPLCRKSQLRLSSSEIPRQQSFRRAGRFAWTACICQRRVNHDKAEYRLNRIIISTAKLTHGIPGCTSRV